MTENRLSQYSRGLQEVDIETARRALDDIEATKRDRVLLASDLRSLTLDKGNFSVWRHDKNRNVLEYTPENNSGYPYEIDLDDEDLKTAAGQLSWIRHIAGKTWSNSPCVLRDLVLTLARVFPQQPEEDRSE